MGSTRNTLTPMIGLSLAALVAGSLITLAVLAQRVTLEGPVGVQEIQPRPVETARGAPPLVVAQDPPQPPPRDEGRRRRPGEVVEDRVLPLRIEPSDVSRPRSGEGPADTKRSGDGKDEDPRPIRLPALPPGLAKKGPGDRGGKPGRGPAAGAKPHRDDKPAPPRASCGEPPCGNAYGHHKSHGVPSDPHHPNNDHGAVASGHGQRGRSKHSAVHSDRPKHSGSTPGRGGAAARDTAASRVRSDGQRGRIESGSASPVA